MTNRYARMLDMEYELMGEFPNRTLGNLPDVPSTEDTERLQAINEYAEYLKEMYASLAPIGSRKRD